ncbi:MAG: polysaccharide deacetylase family protein [Verrucomicrobiae bacterium]|nr:polysaccharide deacetylase family protein [Verrucomicrobiae bacterium]
MNASRAILRRAAARAAWFTGATAGLARLRLRKAPCVALLFHRVTEPGGPPGRIPMDEIAADDLFARLEWLRRRAEMLPAEEWLRERQRPSRPGRPRVLVTFDDGYQDFARLAVPACAALGIRPLLFVSTGFVDDRRARPWWDWLYRAAERPAGAEADLARWKHLAFENPEDASAKVAAEAAARGWRPPTADAPNEFCDWAMLRALRERADFGAHGVSHAPLARLAPERLEEELRRPPERLEAELGARPTLLAYPYGDARAVSPAVRDAARTAGYRAAFRSDGSADARGAASFDLSRVVFPPGPVWRFAAHWARLRSGP